MVRVLLVDDHPVVRSGLRALLEVSGRAEVVGEASSGEEGVTKARSLEPDIVIMDVSMPGIGGIEATRRIAALGLDIKVLVLTMHRADAFLRRRRGGLPQQDVRRRQTPRGHRCACARPVLPARRATVGLAPPHPSHVTLPPATVLSTAISLIPSGSVSCGSAASTAKSASFPAVTDPLMSSSNDA